VEQVTSVDSGKMIAVEARIVVADPSRRDEVLAASVALQAATRTDEAGCLVYCFAADPVEPDRIQVYELWADEASLHAHFEHPNYHAMRELLNGVGLVSAESRRLRIDAAAPVYGPDRRPLVGFPER
jgi:quinol monooxygenase YgiN